MARTGEDISANAWKGLTALIRRRIDDGSLARAFPLRDCPDGHGRITGTDKEMFLDSINAHIPGLTGSPLNANKPQSTVNALDIVDFVALHIDQPSHSDSHSFFGHSHLFFGNRNADPFDDALTPGQEQFQRDIDLLFARNGIAFTLGDDLRVRRLGPPEARPLISDFKPKTGDSTLDSKIDDAVTRFLSRNPIDRRDSLEKLWDAFERLKTLELGGQKKDSVSKLLDRAAFDSTPFRELLEAEFRTLTNIGNTFSIRHHGHDQDDLPGDAVVDYVFIRLAALIALVLRQTGRMN